MGSSVRDPVSACRAWCSCTDFKLSALPQVGSTVSHVLSSQGVFWLAALCLILFAVLVVVPAVWSRKPARRKAALAVLDRIMRWHW
jgi:hypothetical protein